MTQPVYEDPSLSPKLRAALRIMSQRGPLVELTAPPEPTAGPDNPPSQEELNEIQNLVTYTGVSFEALMSFRATVLRVGAERRAGS